MQNEEQKRTDPGGARAIVLVVMAVAILIPSMAGFIMKFVEFIHTFQGEADGAFAITPMLNYTLASLGFLSLLIWAAINGMFRDIERPKLTMLETERMLDQQSKAAGEHHMSDLQPEKSAAKSASSDADPHATTDSLSAAAEHQHHHYMGNDIPWFVRLMWLGFWVFAIVYTIRFVFPAIRIELFQ